MCNIAYFLTQMNLLALVFVMTSYKAIAIWGKKKNGTLEATGPVFLCKRLESV